MKYRVSWTNNGNMFEKVVTNSKLAEVIAEITFWGHIVTVERIKKCYL